MGASGSASARALQSTLLTTDEDDGLMVAQDTPGFR